MSDVALEVNSPELDASFFASAIHTRPGENLVDAVKCARGEEPGRADLVSTVTMMHSASPFYATHELGGWLGDMFWSMLDTGGPLDATSCVAAGGMTSWRGFPEQIILQREAAREWAIGSEVDMPDELVAP